ncbi:hypothetical protein [Tessaracoccus antarcticus]|uniref:Uncharacterized protein n=1 Tax=Tessaracoccus antarcticus TaxID=2479848 RepID=A0A3M0GKL7_9ACTN|nr:hypothetical protein [Tessaracoccus antarcticus]RMB61689.1 hypothetical protein EAX62_03410 [Tessaracoccus antarcticus]
MNALSPEEARQQLAEASDRAELSRSDAVVGAGVTGGIGILVAATLAAATVWRGSPVGLGVSMGVYAVALALLMWWQASKFRISDRRWRRRYQWGFGLTMTLYVVGILWESFAFPGWAIFAPFCVAVAVPALVSAVKMWRG